MRPYPVLLGALLAGALLTPASAAKALPPPLPTYEQPLTPQAVRAVQDRMRQLGVYGGRTDGVWGPDSQAALERFQQTRGLQVTGQFNQATVALLGLNQSDLLSTAHAPARAPSPSSGYVSRSRSQPVEVAPSVGSGDTPLAPLPLPPVGENAPPAAFLQAARDAIAAGRTGEAREGLERAETRALARSVPPSLANIPSEQDLVAQISRAREGLADNNRMQALQAIDEALKNPQASAPSS